MIEEVSIGNYVRVKTRGGKEVFGQVTCVYEGGLKMYPNTGNLEEYEIIDSVLHYTNWENNSDKTLSRVNRIEKIRRRPETMSNVWKKEDDEIYPWTPQEETY